MTEQATANEARGELDEEKSGGTTPGLDDESPIERQLNYYVGQTIHLFLSLLAVLILVAAVLATYDTIVRDLPKLLAPIDEYKVLQDLISNILLIAIAAELGLLLLFHRSSAAIEVIIFVVARKTVSPDITSLDLLLSVAALAALLVVRFYFLPGKPK